MTSRSLNFKEFFTHVARATNTYVLILAPVKWQRSVLCVHCLLSQKYFSQFYHDLICSKTVINFTCLDTHRQNMRVQSDTGATSTGIVGVTFGNYHCSDCTVSSKEAKVWLWPFTSMKFIFSRAIIGTAAISNFTVIVVFSLSKSMIYSQQCLRNGWLYFVNNIIIVNMMALLWIKAALRPENRHCHSAICWPRSRLQYASLIVHQNPMCFTGVLMHNEWRVLY